MTEFFYLSLHTNFLKYGYHNENNTTLFGIVYLGDGA